VGRRRVRYGVSLSHAFGAVTIPLAKASPTKVVVMRFAAIVFLCVVAAVVYGVVHDQVTARICVEYFTIGHPPVFGTDDPTLLGLGWGVIATWWVGVLLGVPLAVAARAGSWLKVSAAELVRPIAVMLAVVGVFAAVAGVMGHGAAQRGWVRLVEPFASRVPAERHVAFITDLWAHLASYAGGFVGGIVLCARVVQRRRRLAGRPLAAER
jgi:hypothetical protein